MMLPVYQLKEKNGLCSGGQVRGMKCHRNPKPLKGLSKIHCMKIYFLSIVILAISIYSCKQQSGQADKIYFNAKIWTGDSTNAWAEAIVIKGNEIIYAGKDYQSFKGSNTEMINLGSKLFVP